MNDAPVTFSYNTMNQLTSQAGGGLVQFAGTTNEPATVTVAGQPAAGAGGMTFTGSATLAAGTSRVAITATDASGNTATQSYDVDVPVSTSSSSYDANGNLIAQGTKAYEWDAVNRLTRVLDDGIEIARFAYDGNGRRAQKTSGGVTHSYVYGGLDILEDQSSSGTIRTVHGPGVDQQLASVDGSGTVSYYLADHLGSIVQQTNASAAVTLTRQYDPYGVPLQGASASGYAFTGREWDAEARLYYDRARYYDPSCGRFLSADPAGFGGGVNLYAYANGNPIRYRDPLGLYGWNDLLNSAVGRALVNDTTADLSAGFGAALTFGLTDKLNDSRVINECSRSYRVGHALGNALTISLLVAIGGEVLTLLSDGVAETAVANEVPSTLARVIAGEGPFETLGAPDSADVFVTDAEAIRGMNPAEISDTLGIPASDTFTVIEFPTPAEGVASPVFRSNPGFVGRGITSGGAPEFVIPNGPVPPGAAMTIIR